MDDEKKSKEQLIKELKTLRQRIAKREKERPIQSEADLKRAKLEHSLQERVKELTCLYGVADLIERHGSSSDKILQGVADLLPGSWQYPEIACARVILDGRKYVSADFRTSRWKQAADIRLDGKQEGAVQVYYLKKKPTIDEGPFLKEERLLINAVAERIGRAVQRIRAEQQLETERTALNNMNVDLREALDKRESLEHSLRERIKELTCLYGVAELIERYGSSSDKILQGIADILPDSWQYPEIARARVILDGKKYVSADFRTSRWKQTATVKVGGSKAGAVEVYYLKKKPALDEGPFLKEERLLIDAVAERIGRAVQRIRAEQQLETERTALNNMNIALREVLRKVEDGKKEISITIQANVDKVIMPILFALENEVSAGPRAYVALLRKNLEDITSPFTSRLSKAFMSLTPAEIQACNMIKSGLSTKEIAGLRHISPVTVNRHREHIRRKLKITNKDVNLATYLQTFMSGESQ